MEINNNKKSAVACAGGCLVSQVILFFFFQDVKIGPLDQSNAFITSYLQQFSLSLCLHTRFVIQIIVSSHSFAFLSDV